MPLPANTTTVVVRGTFNTPEGNPSTGTVTFTPSAWLLNSGANIAIPNSGVTKTLGTAGDFSVTLPITDDPDLSPSGFVYTVSEVVDGVSQSYNISIPGTVATGGTIYLADLAPVAPAGPEYYSLASSLAIGTVTTLAAGSAATATITGLAPSQVLNLGLPTASLGAVTPQALGIAAAGSSGTASREDHVHSSTVANPTFTGVAQFPDGSAAAPSITNTGDTNTGLFHPAEDTVAISTGGTERLRVTSTGAVGIGTSSPSVNVQVVGDAQRQIAFDSYVNSAGGSNLLFRKARGTSASPSAVTSGDTLGLIRFEGHDGSAFVQAARIAAAVDSTPGASDMPTALIFSTTADGAATLTERMRIDSNGLITGTGTSLGAWTDWTLAIGGTGWALGNATTLAKYSQVGKIINFRIRIVWGSTSTFGAAALTITAPVSTATTTRNVYRGRAVDTSTGEWYGIDGVNGSGSTISIMRAGTNDLMASVVDTVPFTWASTDVLEIAGTYEAA